MALGKTQSELLSRLSMTDFIEWAAYRKMKPFGYDIDNMRTGVLCSSIINSAGKSYEKSVTWKDFFNPSYEAPKDTSQDAVTSLAGLFTALAKQQDKDKKKKEQQKELKEAVATRTRRRKQPQ